MALGDFGTFKPRGYKEPLADPEADSVIKRLGSVSSSALQSGLYALDTPGALIRGGLGKLTGAKASDGDRVSGRDLTDHIGLTDKYDKGWGSWGLGLGAEILTDPLTYYTGGAHHALFDSGKAAAKLGATKGWTRKAMLEGFHDTTSGLTAAGRAGDISHMTNQGLRIASPEVEAKVLADTGKPLLAGHPLGALTGWGLPFQDPILRVGTGKTAQKIAGGIDSVANNLKFGALGRPLNALFDSDVNGSIGRATQEASAGPGKAAYEAAQRQGRSTLDQVISHLDTGIKSGIPEADLLRGTRDAIEGVGGSTPNLLSPSAVQAGHTIRDAENAQILAEHAAGINLRDAADKFTSYGPRQGIDIQSAKDIAAGRVPVTRSLTSPQVVNVNNLPVMAGEHFHRDKVWRDVPGGSNQINDFVSQYAGSKLPRQQIGNDLWQQMIQSGVANGQRVDLNMSVALRSKADALAKRIRKLDPDHATHDIGLFTNNEAANTARSGESYAQKMRSQATIHGVIGSEARLAHTLAPDAVPVPQVLKDIGLTYNRLGDAATSSPAQGAMVRAYESLARQGAGKVDPYLYAGTGVLKKELGQYALPRDVYNELMASHGKWSQPEVLKGPLRAFKHLTTTFKNMVYPLFPASNVKNLGGGLVNNFGTGANLGDHFLQSRLMRGTATADELRRRLSDIPVGISDEAARDIARRAQFVDAKVYNGHSGANDLDNNIAARLTGGAGGRVTPDVFGSGRAGSGNLAHDTGALIGGGLRDQVKATLGAFQNPLGPTGLRSPVKNPFRGEGPLAMEDVWGHGNTDFPALQAGRKVGSNIEDFLRGAKYLAERRKGFSGEVAGDATRNLHFDYDNLTKFEKNVMRQAFPFYTYMRKNLPLQAGYLAHHPFYPLTQMRAMEGMRDQSGYTPAYLSGGAAIPIPGGAGGNQRYISGFGTPLEEALERIKFRNGLPDPIATTQAYLASGNPFIKAPIEQIFDKQLSTGRKLSDLRAQGVAKQIGGIWGDDNPQMLAQILANSPAARFASSFDKAADDRKPLWARALNLGTGVKLTDVNTERQQAIEAANIRSQLLSTMPHIAQHTAFTPKRGQEDELTPEEIELLRLGQTMRNRAIEAGKEQQRIGIQLR